MKEERKIAAQLGLLAVDENDTLFAVNFPETHFDNFGVAGLHGPAHELRFNGHFAVAAIDEDAERDALRAPQIEKPVHGGADGAAGVEDVVHEDEIHAVDAKGDVRGLKDGLRRDFGKIVAVEGDVQGADGNVDAVDATHGFGDALGERHAATADANQGEMLGATALLNNLMSKALKSAVDLRGGHQLGFFDDAHVRVILA